MGSPASKERGREPKQKAVSEQKDTTIQGRQRLHAAAKTYRTANACDRRGGGRGRRKRTHLQFGGALGPVRRGPVVAAARVQEDLPAGHGGVLVDGVGQAEPRVLPRHLLLPEVDERLVQPLLQPSGHQPRLLLAGAEDGVAEQLLLHLPTLVSENWILDYF